MERDVRAGLSAGLSNRVRVVAGGVVAFLVTYALVAGVTGGGPDGSPMGLFLASLTACSAAGVAIAYLGPTAEDRIRTALFAIAWGGVVAVLAWNLLVLLTDGLGTTGVIVVVPVTAVAAVIASVLK